MKEKVRLVRKEPSVAHASLASRLLDLLVEAATDEQDMRGRGVLCVKCDSSGLGWTYKLVGECAEEVSEWAELKGLLSGYNPDAEVVIALFDEGAEFFCLPLVARSKRS